MQFLQPDPTLLAFLAIKQTLWLPFVLILALIRSYGARGPARALALLSVLIALAGIAVQVLPGLLGLYEGALVRFGSQWRNMGGGAVSLASASLPLLVSSYLPGRRWWGIDVVHIIGLLGFIGLWAYAVYP